MLRLFESMAFKTRLAGSYTVLVALLLLVSALSLTSLRSTNNSVLEIGENWLPSVHLVDSLNGAVWEYRATVLRHIISSSPQDMQQIESELAETGKRVEQLIADYVQLISSEEERRLQRDIDDAWTRYSTVIDEQLIPASREMRTEFAMQRIQELKPQFDVLMGDVSTLVAINQRGSQAAMLSSATTYSRSITLSLVLLALAVTAAVGMALLMLRSSARQLGGDPALAQDVVSRMSRGEFDTEIPLQAGDRQSVLAGMRQLQLALQDLAQSQNEMLVQHASGVSSHRIDISRLNGGYQKLASISNQLMDQRIALMDEVVTLMQQYSRGDFRNQLRVLPGELRELTEVFGRVRQQLIKLKDASLDLAAAASRGDFSRRGQASEFEFDFREIIDALNNLMANADGGLTEVGKVLGRMADGDLNSRVEGSFEGRFAELRDDTNQMAQQLVQIVSTIIDGSVQVDQAAREIAAANQDLSARTEQQAASLEETASSMEEFTSTVRQNAENARAANQLALNAGGVAERGGAVVGEVVTTMSDIAATSRKISDITSVIDGIAFQTNILALNAAVEAARAGEQGRGFAVVASEVRSLAQRAGTAAREIKGLVDESSSRVETGVKMVQQAGDTMRDILDSVKRLGDLVVEITSASQEQTQGIEQVSTTISQMDQVTQQNAAMVEEAAAAARSLQGQAETLTQAVGFFKIDRARERGAPRQSAAKPASAPAATSAKRGAPAEPATKPRAAGTAKAGRSATAAAAAPASDQWESF